MKAKQPRIGVFVCHCGINIGGVVDVPSVVEYARNLPNVVHGEETLYACSEDGLSKIKEAIKTKKLNRIVVASCTPRTHEPLFRAACQEAGLNPYLLEHVNIREHCSWIHRDNPEAATAKAKDLVRMAVSRAQLLEPQEEVQIEVEPQALVIGGGVAGMHASLSLANQGFQVYLVEKEPELGGMLRRLYRLFPTGIEALKVLKSSVEAVKAHKKIKVFTSSKVKSVEGYIGNFNVIVVNLNSGEEVKLKVGTIIVATGAVEREPAGLYGYGKYKNVITQLQLEELLKNGKLPKIERVVMIQCVGARGAGTAYCGRICCVEALKNALIIKELYPEAEVYILHRDIRAYGRYESYYQKAYLTQIHHVRFPDETPPEVSQLPTGKLRVKVHDILHGVDHILDCDLVILSPPLVQHPEGEEVARMLRVPLGQDRFFLEAHLKLRPVDFAMDGIFVCGTAHGPKDVPESISQAYAAASHAAIPMANKVFRAEAITAVVDQEACIGCGICEAACPFGAAELSRVEDGRWASNINEALCKGCGVCASACPALAITMRHYKNEQVLAQVREAFPKIPEEKFEPRILAFTCNWCSYAGADLAGVSRIQYPPNVRIVRLMCSGRVDPSFILEAFRSGADGVLVSGCHPGDCHYISGNQWAKARFEELREMVKEIGLEPERLRLEWISASEGSKFAETIRSMVEDLKKLSPNPLREVKHAKADPS